MSNNGSKVLHRENSKLKPSLDGDIKLCFEVQERFLGLLESFYRIKHERLIPPPELDVDMKQWRTMAVRYRQGDFRNTRDELLSLRRIAQWTLDENNKLRNQPLEVIDWID